MKKLLFLILLLTPLKVFAAEDRLEPDDLIFSNHLPRDIMEQYHQNAVSVFRDAFTSDVLGRVIVLPPFQKEYAIALARENETYKIKYFVPENRIWNAALLQQYEALAFNMRKNGLALRLFVESPNAGNAAVETCEIEIDHELGDALYFLWSEMLSHTPYLDRRPFRPNDNLTPKNNKQIAIDADGVTYHFSVDYGDGVGAGITRSPDEASVTGRFVAITDVMKDACVTKNTGLLTEMRDNVDQLLAELAASEI